MRENRVALINFPFIALSSRPERSSERLFAQNDRGSSEAGSDMVGRGKKESKQEVFRTRRLENSIIYNVYGRSKAILAIQNELRTIFTRATYIFEGIARLR